MDIQPVELLGELMRAQGLKTQLLVAPYEEIKLFDEMLRHLIYKDFDYNEVISRLEDTCRENTLYSIIDHFETHYILMRLPYAWFKSNAFFAIGPYLSRDYNQLLDEMVERDTIPLIKRDELKEFYCGLPRIASTDQLMSEVSILARYVFGNDNFQVERVELHFDSEVSGPEFRMEPITPLSMTLIEERYRDEEYLLEAIEHGDMKKALFHLYALQKYQMEPRQSDPVRELKNGLIILNTHFRKAVQRADVHPAHIHDMSGLFARRIEAAHNTDTLNSLIGEMIHKYCLLVQNHSLKGYPKSIQKALNYIDFHYTEAIRLSSLSEIAGVNASYLSTQFKKDVGVAIVDYINQRRIEQSRVLLATTNLPVNRVAEMVGYFDDNYFTRLFKRCVKQSPREYRRMLR